MQSTLLDATITCMTRDGYAGTSISSIVEEAGVSRGALLHHFPTKNELIAHAIYHFYEQRLARFKKQLMGAETEALSLEDRLRVLKDDFALWHDTALEIETAMRTDAEIAAIEETLLAEDREAMSLEYEQLFPEFSATSSARELVGIACSMMRGLASTEREKDAERRFKICAAMLQAYLESAASEGA